MMASCAQMVSVGRDAVVSSQVVKGLVEALEQVGVSRSQFLRAAQLDPGELESAESLVPRSRLYSLCELALDVSGDPALGLRWGERVESSSFNLLSYIVTHAATLRQGFESLQQFHRLFSDQPTFRIEECDDTVTVCCQGLVGESPRLQRFISEVVTLGFFRLLRSFGSHVRAQRVSFEYAAPLYQAEYARVFEQKACFKQSFTGVVFDRSLMDEPSPHKDADMHTALTTLAQRRIQGITRHTPYALRVRELLVKQGTSQRADMKCVARSLGMSVRSLRRRLAEEGKMYNDVAHDALAAAAEHLLRDQQQTIQETAYAMGFADTSSFCRAFKRWTGTTPSTFRHQATPLLRRRQLASGSENAESAATARALSQCTN
jgi:AraC-like DNA-binding protein